MDGGDLSLGMRVETGGYSEYSSTTVFDGSKESPTQGDRTISVVTQPPCLGLSIEPINPVVLDNAVKSPQTVWKCCRI
ncbi:hypothetical protein Tco_0726322 [Tanacetum coccineum]|uniref:Uncharacterized protein n=1 Tax=Tanacetum coccineum TaxID=301880 RepID=A0ABQ4YHJ0_9ASTR